MKSLKVTTNGNITIPAELRKKLKLQPGTKVKFLETENGLHIIPILTAEEIKANVGFLKANGKSLFKTLMEEKKLERKI